MTLNRLELHNYMVHRDFAADFNGNLIALTGEMGHGKSTFVGAIQFCLTGEHPPWRREDLVSWGETEGSAKLYFTHNGMECSVMRKLHSTEAVLKLGNETVNGVKNIEKALYERVGVDKEVLKQVGFIQQCEIQTILFDEPAKREKAFQKLIGIGDASKIWSELGPIIQSYSKPENFDASIASMRQTISRLEEELSATDRTLEAARKALDLLPSRDDMKADMERLSKIQLTIAVLGDVRLSIDRLTRANQDNMAEYGKLEHDKKAAMAKLGCEPSEMEASINSLRADHSMALAELNNMKKMSGASDKNGVCPICGSKVAPGQISSYTEASLKRLEAGEKDARQIYESMNAEYTALKNEIAELDRRIIQVKTSLYNSTTSLDAEINREKAILEDFAKLGIPPEQSDMEKLKATVDAELAKYNETTDKVAELSSQVAMLQGEKNAKSQQLQQTNEMLEAKVREKELQAPIAAKVEILKAVRDWFHNSNGPRVMSLNAMKGMTAFVNDYLRKLNSEVEVEPDNQGLSFAFRYVDGRQVSDPLPSAAKLSGGQRISLSLAFIFANYMYFGQKIGIMVLDEPTAHLSPAGVEFFGTMLQTVSTLAKNMNLQIVMPTHEKAILPYMDSEIHFD